MVLGRFPIYFGGGGVYVRGEATRKGPRERTELPASVSRAGLVKTKGGKLVHAFSVRCPACQKRRLIKRKDHAVAHADMPCRKCSDHRPTEIYRGFRMSWFRRYEYNAKMRSKPWDLTTDEAVDAFARQGGRCALSGVLLTTDGPFNDITASLDRIDNDLGYSKDNIHWIHKGLNLMRGDMPLPEFVAACNMVTKHLSDLVIDGQT